MTVKFGCSSSPTPVSTPIQAALDRVTSPQQKLSIFADQLILEDLALPKPYSVPLLLPRTSPVTPILDETSVSTAPSPMDSENDLPLNSIPVAELMSAHLPEDTSLMLIIISGPGLKESGTAMKLFVSAPKPPRCHYGQSRNQRCRAAHAKAREELVQQLQKAADNRFCEWLEIPNNTADAEVAGLLARLTTECPLNGPAVVPHQAFHLPHTCINHPFRQTMKR